MTESQQAAIEQAVKEILPVVSKSYREPYPSIFVDGYENGAKEICTNPEKYELVSKVKYDNDVNAFMYDIGEIYKTHIPLSEAFEFAEWTNDVRCIYRWYPSQDRWINNDGKLFTTAQLWEEFKKQKQ